MFSISDQRMPKGDDRQALEHRREHLRGFMQNGDLRPIAARVGRLFLRYPWTANMPNGADVVAAYAKDLSRFPLWAIDAGIASIIGAHLTVAVERAPSSPVVQLACEAAFKPVLEELGELNRLLDAVPWKEPSPEYRQRIKAGFDDLARALRGANSFRPPRHAKDFRDDAGAPEPVPEPAVMAAPPPLSDRLRRQLGLPRDFDEAAE